MKEGEKLGDKMSVASKNLYDLLGNDDGDSDTPKAPVKTVDKTSTHTVKRNTDGQPPASKAAPAPTTNNRRGNYSGNDAAFRDRNAGSERNRGRPADDGAREGGPRGGRGRGGRGARHSRTQDDRHSKGLPHGGSDKQAAQSWGAPEGEAELKDEQAGKDIAQTEQKDAAVEGDAVATPADGENNNELAEPEDKHISYADYLAQLAEKKLALEQENALKVRKPNEGIKENKKWANAKELVKEDDNELFPSASGKAKRERERKQKQFVEIDNRFIEPDRSRGGRGGRGGGRGESSGRGRGGPRGGGRGDFRGNRDGHRGRGGSEAVSSLNPHDQSAFPSLGS